MKSGTILLCVLTGCGARAELHANAEETRVDGGTGSGGDSGQGGAVAMPGACPTGLPGPPLVARFDASGAPACIDATEVTNAHYAEFLASAPSLDAQPIACRGNIRYVPPFLWPPTGREQRPVVNVDWCDAYAFCRWSGKHLCGLPGGGTSAYDAIHDPAESAWFDACSDHGAREYPYADGHSYEALSCNGSDFGLGDSFEAGRSASCSGPIAGLFDLSGNVWEWEDACAGDDEDANCRVRGGSFRSDPFNLTCGSASGAPRRFLYDDFGFRCCLD